MAGEDEDAAELRQELKAQMERLEKARRVCAGKAVGL